MTTRTSWTLGAGLVLAAVAVGALGVFAGVPGIVVAVVLGAGMVVAAGIAFSQTFAGQSPWSSRPRALLAALLFGAVLFSGGTAAAWGVQRILDDDARGYPAVILGLLGAASIAILLVLLLADLADRGRGRRRRPRG